MFYVLRMSDSLGGAVQDSRRSAPGMTWIVNCISFFKLWLKYCTIALMKSIRGDRS